MVKKLPKADNQRWSDELMPFASWLCSLPKERLIQLLQDALWKEQIQGTELYRFFLCEHYKNITMIERTKK